MEKDFIGPIASIQFVQLSYWIPVIFQPRGCVDKTGSKASHMTRTTNACGDLRGFLTKCSQLSGSRAALANGSMLKRQIPICVPILGVGTPFSLVVFCSREPQKLQAPAMRRGARSDPASARPAAPRATAPVRFRARLGVVQTIRPSVSWKPNRNSKGTPPPVQLPSLAKPSRSAA